ncbi:hypothetical protein ACVI3S_000921 [Bradyrhizobium diazoefficiens]
MRSSISAISAPMPAGSSASMTIWYFEEPGIGRELAGGDDLEPLLRLEAHPTVHALPDHRLDLGALVLEREIAVAGGVGAAKARDLAADPDMAKGILHRPLQGL